MDSEMIWLLFGAVGVVLITTAAALVREHRRARQATLELAEMRNQMAYSRRVLALGELAAGFAHRFNEVLTPILGRTQLAERRIDDPEVREWMATIERAALEGSRIAQQLRDFARSRRDRNPSTLDLADVVHDAEQRLRNDLPGGIVLRTTTDAVSPIVGDPIALRTALLNVLRNSVEAMPDGGTITISLAADQEEAVVTVADTGLGISPEVREHIFEPFFSSKPGADGLGLAITHAIVARHGGQIEFEATPGGGTTLRLRFPLDATGQLAAAPSRSSASDRPASAARRLRCLLVDDDAEVRDSIRDMLRTEGYDIVPAADGGEGYEKFKAEPFDLVITDLAMPNVNGLQLTRLCKRLKPGMPFLMLTGLGVTLTHDDLAEHGIDRMLSKPVRMHDLIAAVKGLSPGS